MSTSSPNLSVTLGSVNGSPIVATLNGVNLSQRATVNVTLTAPYVCNPPKDWPNANPGVNLAQSLTAFTQTIPAGTSLVVFQSEATALVAAGAATLGAIVSQG